MDLCRMLPVSPPQKKNKKQKENVFLELVTAYYNFFCFYQHLQNRKFNFSIQFFLDVDNKF